MPGVEVHFVEHLVLFRAIGVIGFIIYVAGFFCLCTGRLGSATPPYFCLVLVASSCVLTSLVVDFNISAALIQVFYIVMSFGGILLRWRSWRSNRLRASAFRPAHVATTQTMCRTATPSDARISRPQKAPDPVFKSNRRDVTGMPMPGSVQNASVGAARAADVLHLQPFAMTPMQTNRSPQDATPVANTGNLDAAPA